MLLLLSTCAFTLVLRNLRRVNTSISWEIVLTAGFELDMLRGKQPYRQTIWASPQKLWVIITAQST